MGMLDAVRGWFKRGRAKRGPDSNFAGTFGTGSAGGFAGAAVGRLTASLASWSGSVNLDLEGSLPILRARARQLCANNEHGRRFLSLVAANIVGPAPLPKLQVRAFFAGAKGSKPPTLDKAANDAIEVAWLAWCEDGADLTGLMDFNALCRTTVKAVARDGEAIVRIVRSADLKNGIALQLLEADRLDENINLQLASGVIRQGVEMDSAGRRLAYWIKRRHPGDRYGAAGAAQDSERVPAQDIIHIFLPERAEQARGYTWLHAVIVRAMQLHGFNDAAVVAARLGASKVAALQRAEEAPDATATMADAQVGGAFHINAEPGDMIELPPGYTINGWNPEYPHANYESFVKAAMRGIAAGLDVATHNLSGDMTDVNYSSARIAELSEREQWMVLQGWFIRALVRPIYREWLALALIRGEIRFESSGKPLPPERLEKFSGASHFRGRRWRWVDPAKEVEAAEKGVALGIVSRTRLAAEQGEEFEDILDELQMEDGMIAAAGLKPAAPDPQKSKPEDEADAHA